MFVKSFNIKSDHIKRICLLLKMFVVNLDRDPFSEIFFLRLSFLNIFQPSKRLIVSLIEKRSKDVDHIKNILFQLPSQC
jgi:hypothetical protein